LVALLRLGLELSNERRPLQELALACAGARRILGARIARIALWNEQSAQLHIPAAGPGSQVTLPPGTDTILADVFRSRGSLRSELPGGGMLLAVATGSPERCYGVLYLLEPRGRARFTRADERLARVLAAQAGSAYENALAHRELRWRATELRVANERQHASNRFKDELLAIASHDLTAPLANIQMAARLLYEDQADEPLTPEERAKLARMIATRTTDLLALVRNLLDLTRLKAGPLELELGSVRVSEVARKAVEALALNARARGVDVQLVTSPEEPVIQADYWRVFQIAANLLSNAIKYTPAGGQVTLSVAPAAGGMSLAVADTGPGIAADELPHIFDKYHQTRRTGPRPGRREPGMDPGIGLGLTIVQQLVERHHGRVDVRSRPGQGSVFTVFLPARPPGRPAARPRAR
jgi:signal transduction histidine kinase